MALKLINYIIDYIKYYYFQLQTALLQQQAAEVSLEAAKLELAYEKKRMKDQL